MFISLLFSFYPRENRGSTRTGFLDDGGTVSLFPVWRRSSLLKPLKQITKQSNSWFVTPSLQICYMNRGMSMLDKIASKGANIRRLNARQRNNYS